MHCNLLHLSRDVLLRLARISASVVLTAFLLLPVSGRAAEMTDFLPVPQCAEGWSLEEMPLLYTPDTLYERINGESELFFPYGFEMLASGRYESRKNPNVAIEADIYKMGSVLDAFGIFSNYRRSDCADLKVGTEGFVSSSQLLYYQDRFFVRVQVTGTTNPEQESLIECAKAVSMKLPRNISQPKELEPFMVPAVVRKSERYIAQSLLGYSFFRRGILSDAVVADDQFKIFIITEDSPEDAGKALELYTAYLKESGQDIDIKNDNGRRILSSSDPLYKKALVMQAGRHLVGALRFRNTSHAEKLIQTLLKRLAAPSGD